MNTSITNTTNDHVFNVNNFNFHFENERVYNLATNRDYNGKNKDRLKEFCKENNFKYTIFLSFKQGQALGLRVKKGSHGCKVFAGGVKEEPVKNKDGTIKMLDTDTPETKKKVFSRRTAPVFNIDQFELWTDEKGNNYLNSEKPNTELFEFIKNLSNIELVKADKKTNYLEFESKPIEPVKIEPVKQAQSKLNFVAPIDNADDLELARQYLAKAITQLYQDLAVEEMDITTEYIELMKAMEDIATDLLNIQ